MSKKLPSERARFHVVLACAGLLLGALVACREHGRPDPNIRLAISHEREETTQTPAEAAPAGGTNAQAATPTVPTRLEVPPEVLKAYSGIRLRWKDSQSGKEGMLDVPLDGSARIPDSNLEVRANVFLPAFSMTAQTITSTGISPDNPAARISVSENGQEIFAGWIFTRFPDVHPFAHPRYSLRLEGGVPRKAS